MSGAGPSCEWTNEATGRALGRCDECRAAVEASLDGVVGSDQPGGGAGVGAEGDPVGEDWGCSEETVG